MVGCRRGGFYAGRETRRHGGGTRQEMTGAQMVASPAAFEAEKKAGALRAQGDPGSEVGGFRVAHRVVHAKCVTDKTFNVLLAERDGVNRRGVDGHHQLPVSALRGAVGDDDGAGGWRRALSADHARRGDRPHVRGAARPALVYT